MQEIRYDGSQELTDAEKLDKAKLEAAFAKLGVEPVWCSCWGCMAATVCYECGDCAECCGCDEWADEQDDDDLGEAS